MNKVLYKYDKNIHVKIIQSNKIIVPMVTGFLRPTIYLPNIYLPETELTNILQHELTHFLHKDAWTKLFGYLICSAFWWNPFIHTLKSNLNHLLEIHCDLSVTSKMCIKERINYLNSIQRIIKHKLSVDKANAHDNLSMVSVLVSTSSTKKIEQRFGLVLAKQSKKHTFAKYVIYIMLFILFLFSQIFIIQPQYAPLITRGYEETFSITPQTAYLAINYDDTYSLYTIDGQYRCNISDITKEPFSKLPINE